MRPKKVIYIDMDHVLCDYDAAFKKAKKNFPDVAYPQSQYGFFADLKPLNGSISVMQELLTSTDYEPYIASAPSLYNPLSYTEKRIWVEKNLGFDYVERLILIANKSLLTGDILIDDCIEGRGQESFQGEVWQFGVKPCSDWTAIYQALFPKE